MPTHLSQSGQGKEGKSFLPLGDSQTTLEAELEKILLNMKEKKHLGWSLARLRTIEKEMKK